MNIQEAIDACLGSIWMDQRKNTTRSYNLGLRHLLDFLSTLGISPENDISRVQPDHFIGFFQFLQNHYRPQTAMVYMSSAKHFMDWLDARNDIEISYRLANRLHKTMQDTWRNKSYHLPRIPSDEECDKLIAAVKEPSPRMELDRSDGDQERAKLQQLRDIALILFLYWTGCRNQEACSLYCDEVNLQDHTAWIRSGKGRKPRKVNFTQAAADALWQYWTARGWHGRGDPVFSRHDRGAGTREHKRVSTQTVRDVVDAIENRAGLSEITPHKFRHHFATALLSRTGNLALVQDILGHADPRTTRIYAQVSDERKSIEYHDAFGE